VKRKAPRALARGVSEIHLPSLLRSNAASIARVNSADCLHILSHSRLRGPLLRLNGKQVHSVDQVDRADDLSSETESDVSDEAFKAVDVMSLILDVMTPKIPILT
jgi:hypothetical protein